MLLNFIIIQFAPGGPVEQLLSELEEAKPMAAARRNASPADGAGYIPVPGRKAVRPIAGSQGLDPEFIADLRGTVRLCTRIICEDGYDRTRQLATAEACTKEAIPVWERFFIMLWNYVRFDFGESFARSETVINVILDKMPVSISLGLWATLISYLVSIPLGIRKAVKDGTAFDTTTSGVIIAAYALPGFLVPVVLLVLFAGGSYWQWFPLRGLHSEGWETMSFGAQVVDYFHHIFLPVMAMTVASFATLTLLTKNSFLDEIRKQYVMTARSKGLSETRVLYGHVFRNAMLIVIAGFPAAFVSVFFAGSIFVESVFSLDGLGLLALESVINRDYPVVLGSLFIFGLMGLVLKLISDLVYVMIDPRIDFEKREG